MASYMSKLRAKKNRLLRTGDDPILRKVCDTVERSDNLSFLEDVRDVCDAIDNSAGLAAPQIGILKRAAFIRPRGVSGFFIINPNIEWVSDISTTELEGCLSYPDLKGYITRPAGITVSYYDESWKSCKKTVWDFLARVIQHEMDHMEGVVQIRDQKSRLAMVL